MNFKINGLKWKLLNVEQATVYRKRDSALRRFTIALYGVTETE